MYIAVIDGQGGGIGASIVERIKRELPEAEVLALGTNSLATSQMLRAGADEAATGENAIVVNAPKADIICGVVALLRANSLLGELTPKMAEAIAASPAEKLLLPINRCGIRIVSVEELPLARHIDNLIDELRRLSAEPAP